MSRTERRTPETVTAPRGERRRKILALLAGGLVLGVGATATLAAWQDSEVATASFATGTFNIQGSTDGTVFSDSPTAPGKSLAFTLNPELLAPGELVYAPFAVQLDPEADYQALVSVSTTANGALAADLTYSLYTVASFGATCSAATPPGGTALVADRAVTDATAVEAFALADAAVPINLCFVVEAGDGLTQGSDAGVTWDFQAESGDPVL